MYCPNCGMQIPDSEKFCEHCGTKLEPGETVSSGTDRTMAAIMVNKKSEALALILSLLISGLGQMYVGKIGRGLGLLAAEIITAILGAFLLFPLIITLVIWIYAMYDAFKLAKEYNQYLLAHNGNPPW